MISLKNLDQEIQERITSAIVGYLEEHPIKLGMDKVQVTEIASECLRRSYYMRVIGQMYDSDSALRMFVGKAFHAVPILPEHEVIVEWNNIVGMIDEYDAQMGILLEKKTHRGAVSKPYPYHVRQVEYYVTIMERVGKQVLFPYLAYFDVTTGAVSVFKVELTRATDLVAIEMQDRAKTLLEALQKKTPPPREVGWMCSYCPYLRNCYMVNK
jgi:CRISPR/Cas system-associated exonuclease Cas4 (RecB family)